MWVDFEPFETNQFPFDNASPKPYKLSSLNQSACYEVCRQYVTESQIDAIDDLNKRDIYATMNYFELAKQVDMIPKDAMEGDIDLDLIQEKAIEGELLMLSLPSLSISLLLSSSESKLS